MSGRLMSNALIPGNKHPGKLLLLELPFLNYFLTAG